MSTTSNRPRRWLWPCSESALLRHRLIHGITFESHIHGDDQDILLSGSDDDLDRDAHQNKKRRIESLAHSYLSGKPLFIQSAALKGPFGSRSHVVKDKYANYIVGSPLSSDSDAEEPTHVPAKRLPLPPAKSNKRGGRVGESKAALKTPQHDNSSFFHGRHRPPLSDSNHVSPPLPPSPLLHKSVKKPSVTVDLVTAPSGPSSPSEAQLAVVDDTVLSENRPSSPAKPQLTEAPLYHVTAPSAFTPINQPAAARVAQLQNSSSNVGVAIAGENDSPAVNPGTRKSSSAQAVIKSKERKPKSRRSKGEKTYLEAVATHDDSPLMIRRKHEAPVTKNVQTPVGGTTVSASKAKAGTVQPRRVLFDSSNNVPAQSPKPHKSASPNANLSTSKPLESIHTPITNVAPAINMSFDQNSLAVDFDFIDRHTNTILPAVGTSERRKSVSEQLRRMMRQSGASITTSPVVLGKSDIHEPVFSEEDEVLAITDSNAHSVVNASTNGDSDKTRNDDDLAGIRAETEETTPFEDLNLPVVSTQAAMEEAHRGLFDASSPVKPPTVEHVVEKATPGPRHDESHVNPMTITPFHEFNAMIASTGEPAIHSSLPNTQAMFDNMSPFMSPEEPKKKIPAAKRKVNPGISFVPILEESTYLSELVSPEKTLAPLPSADESNTTSSRISVDDGDNNSSGRDDHTKMLLDDYEAASDRSQGRSTRSSSPDVIFSQRSKAPASQRKQVHEKHEGSVRFTDVLQDLQSSRLSFFDDDGFFPNETPQSTRGGKKRASRSSAKRPLTKSRLSGQSSHHSSRKSQNLSSLSQPEPPLRRSLRSRISLSQNDAPLPSFDTMTPTQANVTGSTTIPDEIVPEPLPAMSTASEFRSSNIFANSVLGQSSALDHTRLETSGIPRSSLNHAEYSYQAAQHVDGADLDDTVDDSLTRSG